MPKLRVNGVSIHYEERGEGQPILCIHGTGSSAALWERAMGELALRGRAIAYDRRGCSRSERPQPYVTDVRQHADDAAALLDALDAAPAIVVGRSYGGEVALELAARRPGHVRALAVLEGGGLALSEAGRRWAEALTARVLAAGERDAAGAAQALIDEVLGHSTWQSLPDGMRRIFAGNGAAIVAELRGGVVGPTATELSGVSQPVLVVSARDSPAVFAEAARLLSAALPAARAVRVGGDHLIDPAHPAVLEFLDDVLAA
jgi:esterase